MRLYPTDYRHFCEGTAYGYVASESTSFISLKIGSNWGWAISGPLPITGQLYLGAGGNDLSKGTIVGSFMISHVGINVVVTYTVTPPYYIQQDHFFYGATYPSRIAPGQFGNTHSFTSSAVYSDTFTVPYSSTKNTYIVHAAIGNPFATTQCE